MSRKRRELKTGASACEGRDHIGAEQYSIWFSTMLNRKLEVMRMATMVWNIVELNNRATAACRPQAMPTA